MSFYTSLSGLRAAQTDLSTIANNVANAGSLGFKRSRATFGDLYASAPTQTTRMIPGHGTRLQGITQQFTQGTLEATDRTLDLAITGDGFFVVRGNPPRSDLTFTRAGAFSVTQDRRVVDTTGSQLQLMPVDANGTVISSALGDMIPMTLPVADPADPDAALANISVSQDGVITATYANGTQQMLGAVAMASFTGVEGLRPVGDGHWQATGDSGPPLLNQAANGPLGSVRSGTLEKSNVDLTEELVSLIAAQRHFQANAQAIETAGAMTQTIMNLQI